MKKPFLLLAGEDYYPTSNTGDWQGCFSTREEAEAHVEVVKEKQKNSWACVDWYHIVDLREWTETD